MSAAAADRSLSEQLAVERTQTTIAAAIVGSADWRTVLLQKAVENAAAAADFPLLRLALLAGVVGFANTAVRDCFRLQSRESAVLAHSRKSLPC